MKDIILTRESLVWLFLMSLTLASWLMGTHHVVAFTALRAEGSILLILALIKVHMIINNFMEVRTAPLALKLCCRFWIFGVAMLTLATYNEWISFS